MSTSVLRPVRGMFVHGATGQRPDLFVYIPLASAQLSWCELPDADIGGLSAVLGPAGEQNQTSAAG